MVHGDFRPENIIVCENGSCQIIDLGRAEFGHRFEGDTCEELVESKRMLFLE